MLRSAEEIWDIVKRIDKAVDKHKDLDYVYDIKNSLQWVLQKMQAALTEREKTSIESEIKEIMDMTVCIDEMAEDDFLKIIDFMDKEFDRDYKDRDVYSTGNIADAFDWVLGKISTENFLSRYMDLEKVGSIAPRRWGYKEMNEEEKKELLELVDQMAKLVKKIKDSKEKYREIRWNKMQPIWADIMMDISMARDERGKKIYSNAQMRSAELIRRLRKNKEYQELEERRRVSRNEKGDLIAEYNRLVDHKAILTGLDLEDMKLSF